MKLKLDESGSVVVQDGKPVYVKADGTETAFDAGAAIETIKRISDERDTYRTDAENATGAASKFKGLDPQAARQALAVVKALGDKDLDATRIVAELESAKAEAETYKAKATEYESGLKERDAKIYDLQVGDKFLTSRYVKESLRLPPDIARKVFGENFKVDADGSVYAELDGKKVYSESEPGKPAGFDEAMSILVNNYPHKESILAATGASGSGASGNSGQAAFTAIRSRADLKTAAEKAKFIEKHGFDKWQSLPAEVATN